MRLFRIGAIVTAILAMIGVAPGAASASTTATYRIWHWNIGGQEFHDGSTTNGIIDAIRGSISYRNPDFVSLNEICHNQYTAVLYALRDMGWPQAPSNFARYEPITPINDTYCNGAGYGVALFSRFPLGTASRYTLPGSGPDTKTRKLLCASITTQPQVEFCTTHLTYEVDYQAAQLSYVKSKLDAFSSAGRTFMVAGDFNVQPDSPLLDTWYSSSVNTVGNSNNRGSYHELDDQDPICPGWGEETTEGASGGVNACGQHRKVDMVFADADRLISYTFDAQPIGAICGAKRNLPCSDHRIVDSSVTVSIG